MTSANQIVTVLVDELQKRGIDSPVHLLPIDLPQIFKRIENDAVERFKKEQESAGH
jgi:hypothetical protein